METYRRCVTNQSLYIFTLLNFDVFFLGFWCYHQGAVAKTKRTARRILQVRGDSCQMLYVVMRYIHVHSPNFSPLMRSKKLDINDISWIFRRSLMLFKDFPCDRAFHHNTNQFFYQYFKWAPPPPYPFLSTVFILKQNRMDLNCFSIVYVTIDIDVHINLLFQTWWCHRQRQSGKQIHNCRKSGMLKSVKHWFCIKYLINVLGVDLNYKLDKFQGKCKIVSDFQGRRSETRPDRIRKMFHPEIEEAFPLYTTMKKIRAMDPCPRK